MLAAALVVPELSLGAGELGGGEGRADPTKPAARRGQSSFKPAQGLASPGLEGVSYTPMIDLGAVRARARAAVPAVAVGRGTSDLPAGGNSVSAGDSDSIMAAPALIPPAPMPAPLAVPSGTLPGISSEPDARGEGGAVDLTLPVVAAGRAPLLLPPSAAPAAILEPLAAMPLVTADLVEEPPALVAFAPAQQTALRGPTALRAAATGVTPAEAAPLVARPAASGTAAPAGGSGGRGVVEQLSPARIAAAREAPALAPAPVRAAAPVAGKVMAAAPAAARTAPPPPPVPARTSAPAAAAPVAPRPAPALTAPPAAAPARIAALDIKSQLLTRVDGRTAGTLDFQQTAAGLKVRLGSVVEVLADRYDAAQLARIRTSSAGNAWLSLAELQAQGVPISYDPVYDEFNIGKVDTRPKAARKVHMDQISTPERGAGATAAPQVQR